MMNLRIPFVIAKVTAQEILLDKVLYNLILVGVLLLGAGMVASEMSFVSAERIVLDFGFSAVNISCFLLAALQGSTLFPKEYDRRTVWVVLARPISKLQFVLGKWLGLSVVVTLNWFLLSLALIGLYSLANGVVDATILSALFLLLLQSLLLAALAFVFSSFSTTSISVMVMIGLYLVGNSISGIQQIAQKTESALLKAVLPLVTKLFPNLEVFNLGFTVTYRLPIEGVVLAKGVLYALIWIALSLGAASYLLNRRQGDA